MDLCRICLKSEKNQDIYDIKPKRNTDNKSFIEIILFCLNIQITHNSNISTKLCINCYRKIVTFYKFKIQALKNDSLLRSSTSGFNEMDNKNRTIKLEALSASDNEEHEIKHETHEIKLEELPQDYNSDNEVLSVVKKMKSEYIEEETTENEPVKKTKGRPKKKNGVKSLGKHGKRICTECGKAVNNLKEHIQVHLPAEKQIRIPCGTCDQSFLGQSARYKHIKRKHLGIQTCCKICGKDVWNLKKHMMEVHNPEALPYECVVCNRRFISKTRLDLHIAITHNKDKPHECTTCGKKFPVKEYLQLHVLRVHEKEKTHLCQYCSKSFFKKYHLQVHMRSHTKEKPYECEECSKTFSSSTGLKNHKLGHSNVKAFFCTLCDMSFVKKASLNSHLITHTKVMRYPCQYCGVRFRRSDHRKRHEYTAHQRHINDNDT